MMPSPTLRNARLILPQALHDRLIGHLFPGDYEEHAAVILAGWHRTREGHRLLARELILAEEPTDYRIGPEGFHVLNPTFIHRAITQCRDRRLAYLAVHNHGGRGFVAFSGVDLRSHERGYPALRDIAGGMPVGGLVIAHQAMELDLWLPDGTRTALDAAEIIGDRRTLQFASPKYRPQSSIMSAPEYSRQELFLGSVGQSMLRRASVGIIGLGGVGSIINELVARLGVGNVTLADPETIEPSNFSRIVGATTADLTTKATKVSIAERVARESNPNIEVKSIAMDVSYGSVALELVECDYLFLAADTMRARLVFNAICHQYFVPGVQMGTKILVDANSGALLSAHSSVRHLLPGGACLLCNELIDLHRIADEWKTDQEREAQRYGTSVPDPSVVTMNAVAAAHAVNDFLFYLVGIARPEDPTPFRRFDHLRHIVKDEIPRRTDNCSECSVHHASRYGAGDAAALPCAIG